MAGGYTHLTLVRSSITAGRRKIPVLKDVLDSWGRFTYLGGISPDYPYLGLDTAWADNMHKGKTNAMIAHALPLIHKERISRPADRAWRQKFAWLLGFVSHMVADVTVHPVVNILVGKYEFHKEEHRICEMNQDVWIYNKITGLDLHVSDNMKGEIRSCGTAIDLNDDVEGLWKSALEKTYGQSLQSDQIDRWHAFFIKLIDLAEIGGKIPVFGQHMVSGAYAYPANSELDSRYFDKVPVPVSAEVKNTTDPSSLDYHQPKDRGAPCSFKDIFTKARDNIVDAWSALAQDLYENDRAVGKRHLSVFGDWSLDTGVNNKTQKLIYWP
jgi:hypothetical protein